MSLIFIDCEAFGGTPTVGFLTEFGAVSALDRATFHGVIMRSAPSVENPSIPEPAEVLSPEDLQTRFISVFAQFETWLKEHSRGRPVMVSDNPAYDFQWINDGFLRWLRAPNPFGHSARRISDFYAGLMNDWNNTQKWKRLRRTPHDHNPVHDALGNLEAFERLMKGER